MENEIRKKIEEALKDLGNVKVIEVKGNLIDDPDECGCFGPIEAQTSEPMVTIPLSLYNRLVKSETLYEQVIFIFKTQDSYDAGRIVDKLINVPKPEPEEKPVAKAESSGIAPVDVEEVMK